MSGTADALQPPTSDHDEPDQETKPSQLHTNDGKVDMSGGLPPESPAVEKGTAVDAHASSAQVQDEPEEHGKLGDASRKNRGRDWQDDIEPKDLGECSSRARNVHFDAEQRQRQRDQRGESVDYPKVGQNRARDRWEDEDEGEEPGQELARRKARREAKRMVRRYTGQSPSYATYASDEEAVSETEDDGESQRHRAPNLRTAPAADSRRNRQRSSNSSNSGSRGSSSRRRTSSLSTLTSDDSDDESTSDGSDAGDDSGRPTRKALRQGGILSNLFKLHAPWKTSGSDDIEAQRGEVGTRQALLNAERRAKAKMRRRWTENTLFSTDSRRSSMNESDEHRSRMMSQDEAEDEAEDSRHHEALDEAEREERRPSTASSTKQPTSGESSRRSSAATLTDADQYRQSLDVDEPDSPSAKAPVVRKRNAIQAAGDQDYRRQRHEMKENLNRPYIPAGRTGQADFLQPSIGLTMAQQLRRAVTYTQNLVTSGSDVEHVTGGKNRSMAALIITTNCLLAPASPQLAHLAPASGHDAESNTGRRKVVLYSNPREEEAREKTERALQDRAEAAEMGENVEPKNVGKLESEILAKTPFTKKDRRSERRKHTRGVRTQREIRITKHIADLIARENFVLDLAKALVNLGAPTHTVESWLDATAFAIEVDASFIYFPSVLIVAFHDADVRSSSVSFIKPSGGMDLYRLSLVHNLYRKVVHDDISVSQGSRALRRITKETKPYHWTILLAAGSISAAAASGVAFSGSLVDIIMSGALGLLIPVIQMFLVGKQKAGSNIFEIGAAGLIAFIGRALGGSGYFCYSSVISASIVLILPGWMICLGSVEIGSRAVVPGAIRTVWAIVYTLFLSFALSIGSELFDLTGVTQPTAATTSADGSSLSTIDLSGTFQSNNTSFDNMFQNGTITLTNGTASTTSVACYRNPAYASSVWYNDAPDWTLFITVPVLAVALAIWNKADWRSRDLPVMVIVASAGYVVNYVLTKAMINQPNVVTAAAAFTIGLLANLYSRVWGGSAFPVMLVAILLEVPNSIVASGGLSISSTDSDDDSTSINSAVLVSIRLVQSGISLAVGIFAAAAIVYPLGKKGRFTFAF